MGGGGGKGEKQRAERAYRALMEQPTKEKIYGLVCRAIVVHTE